MTTNMLNERRNWEYYTVYSIVTDHPIFNLDEAKQLFEIFAEFAKDSKLFKAKPKDMIAALKLVKYNEDSNVFKTELLNWMVDDFTDGISFNDFMCFMATESFGKDYKDIDLSKRLMYFLSLGTNDLRQKDIDDFCKEFNCYELQDRLTKWREGSKNDK